MEYTDIIARAKQITRQPAEENSGWWMDDQWLGWLNLVHLKVVRQTKALKTKATATCTVDQDYITMPSKILLPTQVYLNNKLLTYKSPEKLSLEDPNWVNNSSGQPSYWYLLNGNIYFEKPADSTYSVIVFGVLKVTDMSTSQTTPFNNVAYLQEYAGVLVKGLVADFFSDSGDTDKKSVSLVEFRQLIAEMAIEIKEGLGEEDGYTFENVPKTFSSEV